MNAYTDQFIDLYEFLGIPAGSPPALIYLAITKIRAGGEQDIGLEVHPYLALAREHLLNSSAQRECYEKQWVAHCLGSTSALDFFQKWDRQWPIAGTSWGSLNCEGYLYFATRSLLTERQIFPISTVEPARLTPLKDVIYCRDQRFYLESHAEMPVIITNLNLGKMCEIRRRTTVPLTPGDRIEFGDTMQLAISSIYIENPSSSTNGQLPVALRAKRVKDTRSGLERSESPLPATDAQELSLYLARENAVVPLQRGKQYLIGRNPSVMKEFLLSPRNGDFSYIATGHDDRSVSRLNFQLFCREDTWYVRDTGSWYGTTFDGNDYSRLQTLGGGETLPLQPGKLRLGYDKSCILEVDTRQRCEDMRQARSSQPGAGEDQVSVYDLPLLTMP